MSYSGEWIYSIQNNLQKDSRTTPEILDESLSSSVPAQCMNLFILKIEI